MALFDWGSETHTMYFAIGSFADPIEKKVKKKKTSNSVTGGLFGYFWCFSRHAMKTTRLEWLWIPAIGNQVHNIVPSAYPASLPHFHSDSTTHRQFWKVGKGAHSRFSTCFYVFGEQCPYLWSTRNVTQINIYRTVTPDWLLKQFDVCLRNDFIRLVCVNLKSSKTGSQSNPCEG